MNKQELIAAFIKELDENELNVTQKEADIIIKAFISVLTNNVAAGKKISVAGLGTFETKHRNAREGRNPSNGETIQIPEKTLPKFKAANAFKNLVAEANA